MTGKSAPPLNTITNSIPDQAAPARPRIPTCVLRAVALLLVAAITLLITFNRSRLEDVAALGYSGAFLVMLLSNATLILPAPGLVFVFALGSSLNPIAVGFFAALGAALGEMTGYATGYSGMAVLENTAAQRRISRWMNHHGTLTIFLLSIFPNPFFDLAGILAGTGRMPIWRFLTVAAAGKFIQATLIALAGALSIEGVEQWLSLG